MKKIQFKKILLVMAVSILAVFSISAVVSADSYKAELQSFSENETVPVISSNETYAEKGEYVGYTSSEVQTAATYDTITIKWNSASYAAYYKIYISYYNKNDFTYLGDTSKNQIKITNLKAGTAYSVRIVAANESETSGYYRQFNCTTLYKSVKVKSTSVTGSRYTFNMDTPTPVNSVTGYRVSYYNYKTKKTYTQDFNNQYTFSISLNQNTFYKVKISPYITLSGKKYISSSGTTKYIALQPALKKGGNTKNSMTVRWDKVSGATSYTIYIKYPGSSSFKKVGTTTKTSCTLNNMKLYTNYYIKVIANKKVGNTTWKTKGTNYSKMRLYRI